MTEKILSTTKLERKSSLNFNSASLPNTRVWDGSNRFIGEFPILISYEEVNKVIKRIMAFSIKKIDQLWHDTGYIFSERDNNLALPNERLEKIKKDFNFARQSFLDVIGDTPGTEMEIINLFLNNLKSIEAQPQ